MNFDLENYRTAKSRITGLIEATHDMETEGFIDDGVICPEVYAQQKRRILCILAESYGYDKSGVTDIERQRQDDLLGLGSRTVQTPRRLTTMLCLLQRSLDRGSKVTREEWKDYPYLLSRYPECFEILQDSLSRIAWVNVKKASNGTGTKLTASEVRAHAHRNKEVLSQQIDSIAPDVILICGVAVFQAILELGILGPNVMGGRQWQAQKGAGGQRVIEIIHPGARQSGSYESLYANFERIYDQIT